MYDLPPTIASASTSSRKLAEILEAILENIEQGKSVDIEALKVQHPDIAPTSLREPHWDGALQFAVSETAEISPGLIEGALVAGERAARRALR